MNSLSYFFHLLLLFTLLLPLSSSTNELTTLLSWTQPSRNHPTPPFSNINPLDTNPCKWSFITCSSQNLVTEITIQNVQLALPFPPNISSFSSLQKLVISGTNLTGTIPAEIGNCLNLITIDLSSNSLVGEIPSTIGNLKKLENLILNSNQLSGSIPIRVGDCVSLKTLDIFDNNLTRNLPHELGNLLNLEVIRAGGNKDIVGKIPEELGECRNLTVLGLADTRISGSIPSSLGKLTLLQTISIYSTLISGEIPREIGNCSELVNLFLYENDLSGEIPFEIGKLVKLEKILLWQNSFVGGIPDEIGNCSSLKILDLSLNFLSGGMPKSLGKLSNLEELMLSNNNISGSIPGSISNLTNLIQLQLDTNEISGLIPAEIGKLTKLTVFFAWQNRLEGRIPSELGDCLSLEALDLSYNDLSDSLPSNLFTLRNLTKLLLISNDISGSIPPEIGNCSSLIRLRLVDNRINGEIPREIGFLNNLSFLDLSGNRLSGSVPLEIGKCRELQMLNLSNNSLSGDLHSYLSTLMMLEVLDVSMNNFSGEVPMSIGQLTSLLRVTLSKNSFSGSIPSTLGKCSGIQLLDLSKNMFSGSIPRELFQIEALDIALNLSHNALSGVIPVEISALNKLSVLDISHNNLEGDLMVFSGLENLVSLNISYNQFTGYLPDSKLFHQLAATDLDGNHGLCPNGHDSCFIGSSAMTKMLNGSNSKRSEMIKVAIGLLSSLAVAMAIFGVLTVFRARKMVRDDNDSEMGGGGDSWPWQFTPFQKVNFRVDQILKCLVESNVIGKGCSGIVYRAEMENGDVIAVKRLWPTTTAATSSARYVHSQSDKLAVNGGIRDSFSAEVKTLGSIRHKNIVRFLGCCWNRNTRLLMYDYMPNGSLGGLLHERSGNCLEWHIRFKIILGAAQGLAYLHHDCAPPIVHRDIKANNILIGLEFEPYIADFGLAKLVDDGDFARSSSTLAGSYGYIAPEYGYMMKITEKSDVYSYGIVVLEVLTGKQPIDPTIPDGLHIVDWVRQKRGRVEVLDETLTTRPESEIEEMLQTLGVALLCVTPSPDDRPTMKDVVAMMKEIKQERDECVKVFDQHESNHSNEAVEGMKHSCPATSSSNMNVHLHYSPHISTTLD
ncbi:LRR receptor-like serine/threonine-protein kinase RGI2 [Vicia villosa]|uniref:LRR receptor-like serine/threonine-protein kinase RGI2 n=1 Tax=Vicia villosa TaxID=3911 RepID=UPI00273C6846|nr:LRR receptor-like serine/threonine-protein kinase RGI2 [Vicia villosa]